MDYDEKRGFAINKRASYIITFSKKEIAMGIFAITFKS